MQIFETASTIASLKQIVAYVPDYVHKALSDAELVGLPITLANFKDGIMETAHKENKKKLLLFSSGAISKAQYQKQVIRLRFANEVFQLTSRESIPLKSPTAKAEKKRQSLDEREHETKKVVNKLQYRALISPIRFLMQNDFQVMQG